MLRLNSIVKTYSTGAFTQNALNGVSLSFRESEFVAILGPSGSGKTTLLNLIGGLDRYTSGDLIINGVSTKEYRDADWDCYRNNSIGFVFQSYNLIPHQTVLANVEMALTLAGVSRRERRQRAASVLKKVGLGEHLHKKPNQLSGGQMQRVAIARALINNPDILLADEPTGALDSETSVQIMELLKEIAKDKLVIMVTHNPELAELYATRIVRLKDGRITDDSNPCSDTDSPGTPGKLRRVSMSFFTALSLSFNNLRTKKGRTLLTAFAGSIGIIGIALILALSTGMSAYITDVQKETMSSYPITISSRAIDISGVMGVRGEMIGAMRDEQDAQAPREGVWADYLDLRTSQMAATSIVENDLTAFKQYLDDPDSEIRQYLGENGIVYTYDVKFSVYSHDADGQLVNSDADAEGSSGLTRNMGMLNRVGSMTGSGAGASHFSELMPGADGAAVSPLITDSYQLLYGSWPQAYNEVLLVLDANNRMDAGTLYQLGLITRERYDSIVADIREDGEAEELCLSYREVCQHSFYLVAACDRYEETENGTFAYLEDTVLNDEALLENAVELTVTGVVRPLEDAANAGITTAVAYTSALTDHIIAHTNESAVVLAQEASPDINVLTGMRFESGSDASRAADARDYLSSLGISEKASFYQLMAYYSGTAAGAAAAGPIPTDETQMARALDLWLANDPSEELLLKVYDQYLAGSTCEDNLDAFGKVSYDAPASISIYTDTFESKDSIAACITHYNEGAGEDARITYTDYVALLTSSLTTIIDGISYVLVAFVSISLVVSCIMIGIITHISVMERTKEIGILRALGASRRNISQVFNAETFIIGCCAGLLGIGVSRLALFPINSIIERLSGLTGLEAQLPASSSLILIGISIVITILGGLLPARKAARQDPVIALRTE